jgi:prophage regulatory protein
MNVSASSPRRILRLAQVIALTGLSRSTIYQFLANDGFPKQIRLGARSVGWVAAEIDEWISSRIDQSRNSQSANAPARAETSISKTPRQQALGRM